MKSTRPPRLPRGLTLTELLVVLVIIAVLATLTFTFVSRAREAALRATSASNLRQIGGAVTSFVTDNYGFLPASRSSEGVYWPQLLLPYCATHEVFLIPKSPDRPMDPAAGNFDGYFPMSDTAAMTPENTPIRWNYVINGGHNRLPFAEIGSDGKALSGIGRGLSRPLSQLTDPGSTVMFAEGTSWWLNAEAKPDGNRFRKWSNGSVNFLFGDGSVRGLNPKDELSPQSFWAVK